MDADGDGDRDVLVVGSDLTLDSSIQYLERFGGGYRLAPEPVLPDVHEIIGCYGALAADCNGDRYPVLLFLSNMVVGGVGLPPARLLCSVDRLRYAVQTELPPIERLVPFGANLVDVDGDRRPARRT